jgi:hypothetical protein
MIVTPAGRVIVNTGMGFEALVHRRLFDTVCAGPTPYIVLTQGHVDHVGGVAHFREPGTQLIAQRNLPQCQRDDRRIKQVRESQAAIWFGEVFEAMAKRGPSPERPMSLWPRASTTVTTSSSAGVSFRACGWRDDRQLRRVATAAPLALSGRVQAEFQHDPR